MSVPEASRGVVRLNPTTPYIKLSRDKEFTPLVDCGSDKKEQVEHVAKRAAISMKDVSVYLAQVDEKIRENKNLYEIVSFDPNNPDINAMKKMVSNIELIVDRLLAVNTTTAGAMSDWFEKIIQEHQVDKRMIEEDIAYFSLVNDPKPADESKTDEKKAEEPKPSEKSTSEEKRAPKSFFSKVIGVFSPITRLFTWSFDKAKGAVFGVINFIKSFFKPKAIQP